MCRNMHVQSIAREMRGKALGALCDPEAFQKDPLRGQSRGACGACGFCQWIKGDMRGQIRLSGVLQRVGVIMGFDRLEAVGTAQIITVIDT